MATLTTETHEKEKPIILFTGKNNSLITILIQRFAADFKIAYVTDEQKLPQESTDFYRIDLNSAYLIKNLEEKIDYAVIFPQESRDRNYLQHVFKKLTDDDARTIVLLDVEKLEQFLDILLEYKRNPNFYFLIVGDIYSEKANIFSSSQTERIIKQAVVKKTFNLSGNELTPIYPIFLEDAINGISQTLFGPSKKEKIYNLYYSNPQTYLSAVHILKRIEPDLEVSFDEKDNNTGDYPPHSQTQHLIESKTGNQASSLDKYFEGFEKSIPHFVNNPSLVEEEEENKINKVAKKIGSSKRHIKFSFAAIATALVIYVLVTIIFLGLGLLTFKASLDAFEKQDYKTALEQNKNSAIFLNTAKPTVDLVVYGAKAAGFKQIADKYDDFSKASQLVSLAANDLDTLKLVAKGIDEDSLNNLIADAYYLYFKAQDLKTSTNNEKLSNIGPQLSRMLSIASVLPDVGGYKTEKKYLLLFQNNGELRPTGGFIGSVGVLTLKDGKVSDLKINDVYDFDGQLKTHIEPNHIIKWYLQPDLYLRDSNFDPDFQNSASIAAQLFNLESGQKVDGVIAINYDGVKQIIDALGPVKLTGYDRVISGTNAFEFLQNTIDNNFFPGSTEKREVLSALYNALLLKIQENPNNALLVAKLIPKLANEKDIMFAFGQGSVQSAFSKAGYAGEYKDSRAPSVSVLPDFLAINEANIGVNKANIEIARKTEYKVNMTNSNLTSSAIQTLTNTGDKTYAAYIRFFVPLGSNLTSIKINGQDKKIVTMLTNAKTHDDNRFTPSADVEVEKTREGDKQIFGFVISVPSKSNQIIEVSYDNGARIPSSSNFDYSLLLIKQPGTGQYPFDFNISFASNFSPQQVKGAKITPGNIQIKKNVNSDREFDVEFIKK